MTGNYVDDDLNAGIHAFGNLTDITMKQFDYKKRKYDNFGFFSARVITTVDESFEIASGSLL